MAILIETMRREGFEFMVGRPQVIYKKRDGKTLEPLEHLFIDCDENFIGVVSEKLSRRKGRMVNLTNHGTGQVRMEFTIPSRTLIGYRNEFLTDTKGTGLMNSYLEGYDDPGTFPCLLGLWFLTGWRLCHALNLEPGALFLKPGRFMGNDHREHIGKMT
jgi:GTP-binding protein